MNEFVKYELFVKKTIGNTSCLSVATNKTLDGIKAIQRLYPADTYETIIVDIDSNKEVL